MVALIASNCAGGPVTGGKNEAAAWTSLAGQSWISLAGQHPASTKHDFSAIQVCSLLLAVLLTCLPDKLQALDQPK